MKRPDSSIPQFAQRIPRDVLPLIAGRTLVLPLGCETVRVRFTATMRSVRFSLRTRDPAEAKARQGQAAAALERFWVTLRTDAPAALSHQQATALAGELYRAWSDGGADRTIAVQHTPDGRWERTRSMPAEEEAAFASARGKLEAAIEAEDTAGLEPTLGPLVDRLLLARGVSSVDADSRAVLLDAFARALRDAFAARERHAVGDYSPDPNANRFPEWQQEKVAPPPSSAGKTTLTGLVSDWWTERQAAGLKPSTHESYRNTVAAFVAYLKHNDAGRVTAEDVLGFKDHRLATINPRTGKAISAKTVKDSDIAGLKAIFAWAVANRRMASNPAKDVTLKLGKARKLRSKGLSDEEAHAILRAALAYQPGKGERPQTAAAKRWVPWLAAYTGARVGELAQLRKQDLRQQGPHWLITITPEAGTVKTNEVREVVLHSHLVELGFPEFVAKAPAGHLFLKLGSEGDVLGRSKA